MDARFGEMLDTPPDARARYYEMIARMTPDERVRKVVGLSRAARELARAGIRMNLPLADPLDVELELIARLYGSDAARHLAPYLRHADRD
jgi:hypothetical protein